MRARAVLLDMDGVLYVGDQAIPGAPQAVAALREAGFALRFVTNTTARSRARERRLGPRDRRDRARRPR